MDEKKKRFIFLGITGFLVLAITATIFYVNTKTPSSASTNSGTSIVEDKASEEGKITIKDANDGEMEIPKYSIATSKYDIDKLTEENGIVSYNGEKHIGITVSDFHGAIDWEKVAASGVEFAFIRVGFRGVTDGRIYSDNNFADNMAGAEAAGIKIGVYFYSHAITEIEAEEEAEFVSVKIKSYRVTYPVAFIWEFAAGDQEARTQGYEGSDITRFANAFCSNIKKAGYTAMFLADKQMGYEYFNLETLKDFDLWYVEYKKKPAFHYNYTIWQYTSEGNVPGIEKSVKMSYSFTDYDKS